MKYTIKGYTGPNPDFTDIVIMPSYFELADVNSDNAAILYRARSRLLLAFLRCDNYPSEYLHVFIKRNFESRPDLADHDGQIVLLAEAYGCEHCQAQGDNEYDDGCDDAPHGGFMLVLEPVVGEL